jgi:(p)ppGpp synthase/HD superfamily hydrolase
MVSLNTKLQSGDIVEILTTKNSKPKQGWLDKVGSKHARHKLLSQLHALFPNFVAAPPDQNKGKKDKK